MAWFLGPMTDTVCGMFTAPHLIAMALCLLLVFFFLWKTKDASLKTVTAITRWMGVLFAVLELCKITYKFYYHYTDSLEFYFPLSFCSLFIYATLCAGFGKGKVKEIGQTFIACGCFGAGLAFLIFPTTSLMDYPIYHFLSLHSMAFHSCMIFLSILYIRKKIVSFTPYRFFLFGAFVSGASLIACLLNLCFDGNLMMLRNLVNIPFPSLTAFFEKAPVFYTILAIFVYATLPFLCSLLMDKIFSAKEKKQ